MSETAIRLPLSGPSTVEEQFARLVTVWKEETLPLSSSVQMTAHPAYQAIIALGPAVIPLLLHELERSPDHWFVALRTLTGANPVQPEQQGRLNEMANTWLQWAKTHWPDGVPQIVSIETFTQAYQTIGCEVCLATEFEPGYEKIALYADANGAPTHAAKQLASGMWSSKIGRGEDIEHALLESLTGPIYGEVVRILRRRVTDG